MVTNGNGDAKKRLEFLEKVYLEDRERWQKSEERWRKSEERWRTTQEELRAQGARLDKAIADNRREHDGFRQTHGEFQEDFNEMMKTIVEEQRRSRKVEARLDATLRIIRRRLEK